MKTKNNSILENITELWDFINRRRRIQFFFLLLLMVITSLSEAISLGAVLPFLVAITDPTKIIGNNKFLSYLLNNVDQSKWLLIITIFFITAVLLSGAIRLILIWSSVKLSYISGGELGVEIYKKTLYQPYLTHITRNSSQVIDGIINKSSIAIGIIDFILSLISSLVLIIVILLVLIFIDPVVSISVFTIFGIIYLVIAIFNRKKLSENGKKISVDATFVIKSLQEGLGGIRDVLIDGTQPVYIQIYQKAAMNLRRVQASNQFIISSPRYAIEALGTALIAIFAFVIIGSTGDISKSIPTLGVIILGSQRLLPLLQQLYGSWSGIKASQESLIEVIKYLKQDLPNYAADNSNKIMNFKRNISIKNLYFRYGDNNKWLFKDFSVEIKKGERIGIIGVSGGGKSTLMDIISGLLAPTKGCMEIDGVAVRLENSHAWQKNIAHVSQSIYLADISIAENIAFGVPKDKINYEQVEKAAEKAQLNQYIMGLEKGLMTVVGERGVQLSGGQRQRIGIARALYKNANVIIFDEATSALDGETEKKVMDEINLLSKDLTIIIVAHRLSTLENCNRIIRVNGSGEIDIVSINQLS